MIHSHELANGNKQKQTNGSRPLAGVDNQEHMKMPAQLIHACINLYGVADCDFLIRQISRMPEGGRLQLWEFINLVDALVRQDDNILQQGPWLYSRLVCPTPLDLSYLLEEQVILPYRDTSIEALLPYADNGYYEQTKELEALLAFLSDRCAAADRLVQFVGRQLRFSSARDVMTALQAEADCSCLDQDELRSLITAAEATTRKVRLRGHTPQEESALCED